MRMSVSPRRALLFSGADSQSLKFWGLMIEKQPTQCCL